MAWVGTDPWIGAAAWPALEPLPAPLTLTVTPVTTTRNDLAWTAIPRSFYDIERNGVVIVYAHPTNSYSDTAATSGSRDTYRVRAVYSSA